MHKNEFGQIVGNPIDGWVTAKNPIMKNIHGQYCTLEQLNILRHADELFNSLSIDNHGESWTYLPYGPFETYDSFENWLNSAILKPNTLFYVIKSNKTQKAIGLSAYLQIRPVHGVIEIGHLHFSKLLKRTPLATEVIYLMLQMAFDELNYRRCEWKCNSLNENSRQAALRFGFQFEGIFRQNFVFKNRNRDTAWFSIIDSEWPLLKIKFEKWLNPNNFDASGKQILKLSEC